MFSKNIAKMAFVMKMFYKLKISDLQITKNQQNKIYPNLLARDRHKLDSIHYMSAYKEHDSVMTVPSGVGSAVGVTRSYWYVAIVKNNTEISVLDKLTKLGYKCYVPLQNGLRVWKNGRKSNVERVVIPTIIFINCTESSRKEIVRYPYILRFMTNRAGTSLNSGSKPLAIIPEAQIKKLMFMVGNSDTPVVFSSMPYIKGDWVKVIRGKLAGLEGEVKSIDDKHSEVIVSLDFLGNARLTIETIDIEPIKKNSY